MNAVGSVLRRSERKRSNVATDPLTIPVRGDARRGFHSPSPAFRLYQAIRELKSAYGWGRALSETRRAARTLIAGPPARALYLPHGSRRRTPLPEEFRTRQRRA